MEGFKAQDFKVRGTREVSDIFIEGQVFKLFKVFNITRRSRTLVENTNWRKFSVRTEKSSF